MAFKKGNIPWNKKEYLKRICLVCNKVFFVKPSRYKAKFCSSVCSNGYNNKKGNQHPHWKGGKVKHSKGYFQVYNPNHPFANHMGYILEHRLVMEKYLRRYLKREEVVHHKNEILTDNRLENLLLFPNTQKHLKFHKSLSNGKPIR